VLGTQLVLPGSFFPSAPPDLAAGLGKNDQKLYVIPSLDRVIIRMGNDADEGGWANSSFDEQLWQRFVALDAALGMCDCSGDLNGDGLQGMPDVLIMLSDFGCNGEGLSCAADLNGDGLTDVTDVLALLSGFGAPCSP
jgi:hypothetical protein